MYNHEITYLLIWLCDRGPYLESYKKQKKPRTSDEYGDLYLL